MLPFFISIYNMTVEHKNIVDPDIHEPKGVSTASASNLYVANGSGSGSWRKVKESDLDFTDPTSNKFGWNYRVDTQYTSGAPLSITASTKTAFPNNGLGTLTDTARPLGITFIGTTFTPSTLNSSYVIRIAFKVKAAAVAGTPYTIKVTMEGGASPLKFAGQDVSIKGGSYENDVTLSFLFFTGSLNTNNPITIYLTPDTDVTVYDCNYLIQRTYLEV